MSGLQTVSVEKKQPQVQVVLPNVERYIQQAQKTIANVVSCKGIGVHSGTQVNLSLHPAVSGSGIVFIRTDLDGAEIKGLWQNVVDTRQCTTLGNSDGVTISTVEHLLAALAAKGIDNVRVELDGSELPIMDGSAQAFVSLIEKAGIREQCVPRRMIRVLKTVTVEEGDRKITLSPAPYYELEVDFDFAGRTDLTAQNYTFRPLEDDFDEDISAARTFGLMEDAERIWAMGLAKGASLENTLVYDGTNVMNEEGSRYDDECVRHKVLDALGDLHLAGGMLLGKFHGVRTGHTLHHKLLLALFADPSAYSVETTYSAEAA